MLQDYKKLLDRDERRAKLKRYVLIFIIFFTFVLLVASNYYFQQKSSWELATGQVTTVTHFQRRGGSFFQCKIAIKTKSIVEAECFRTCQPGDEAKLNKIVRPYDIVNYQVLSCKSNGGFK